MKCVSICTRFMKFFFHLACSILSPYIFLIFLSLSSTVLYIIRAYFYTDGVLILNDLFFSKFRYRRKINFLNKLSFFCHTGVL